MLIDTHCHLDDIRYIDDLDDVIKSAKNSGIYKFIIPAASPKTLQRAVEIATKYDEIYFSVGIHPSDIIEFNENFMLEYINHPKCIAVGEIGLDYYRLPKEHNEAIKEKKLQRDSFVKQIEIAKSYKKPMIVHIRDASVDAKEVLLASGARSGVLHCYNADEVLLDLANSDFYFGIGGVVTFANAKKLPHILKQIPLDRIVLETDAPYLTPHPYRGSRNEPRYIENVARKVSEILDISFEEISSITSNNANRLFFGGNN